MHHTCTSNGRSGWFTVTNRMNNSVITFFLNDGQTVALVDNVSDSIDGILVDDNGKKIKTLFINLRVS
uniref:Uncharacterized protein n=1 Tax=Physcomitrium patens TaxID=3218 RepID=A0A2K1K029_PHYPA|nr:hypothetical protein PHYPA_014248 [Physcomitrium patens]